MKLTTQQKDAIKANLQRYIASYGSQNKAANSLDVAAATLSSINKGDYPKISDEMWLKLSTKIGGDSEGQRVFVKTSVTRDLSFCMRENRLNRDFIWAISPAGSGKTIAAKMARNNPNTLYILCDEDMKKKEFALEFARSAGLDVDLSKNARHIILEVVEHIRKRQNVLLIFDEADKLSDNILNYFITIFNYFEDMSGNQSVGIQFISTDFIAKRMKRGLNCKKKGYQELWSRLGAKFYEVDRNTAYDVEAICRARGIVAQVDINRVVKEADLTNYDLRRVARKINAIKRENQTKGV
ncbi:MAG: ATP-binding protein [Rikenellaceae bacterium]